MVPLPEVVAFVDLYPHESSARIMRVAGDSDNDSGRRLALTC
jgi:hypothetical protein